jgi:hypothetical protein
MDKTCKTLLLFLRLKIILSFFDNILFIITYVNKIVVSNWDFRPKDARSSVQPQTTFHLCSPKQLQSNICHASSPQGVDLPHEDHVDNMINYF